MSSVRSNTGLSNQANSVESSNPVETKKESTDDKGATAQSSDAKSNHRNAKANNGGSSITRELANVTSSPKLKSDATVLSSASNNQSQAKTTSGTNKAYQNPWNSSNKSVTKNESPASQKNSRTGSNLSSQQITTTDGKSNAPRSNQSSLGFLRSGTHGENKSKQLSEMQHSQRESNSKNETARNNQDRDHKQPTTDRHQDMSSKRTISTSGTEDIVDNSSNRSSTRNNTFNNNNVRGSTNHHNNQNNEYFHNFDSLSKTNLYIRGLDINTTDNDLYTLCSKFGKIVSTKAILDKLSGKCKGYGFVDFEAPSSAENAVVELQKQGILVHMAKQQEADPTNLYLANLPLSMDDLELEGLLLPFGNVVSTRILFNQQSKQSRGVGFARMGNKDQCDEIISQLNGQILKESKEPLLIKFADGANKKKPHHNNQAYQYRSGGALMGDWRSSNNEVGHHVASQGVNRNFHNFYDQPRQNNSISNSDNGSTKHSHGVSAIPGYHAHHPGQTHSHQMPSSHLNPAQPHQGHHQDNPRTQSSNSYSFPMSGTMNAAGDASQWMHPSQAGQPYVIPQMLHPSSLHYMNLATQMQGMQLNPGYMSSQQWSVWPSVNAKHTANPDQAQAHMGNGGSQPGYTETD